MPRLDLGRLPSRPTTRFAPSPTGELHLGHVANAVWVWGLALATDGRVLLRIEDHDRGRSRPTYEAAILADLDWLGLEAEAGSRASLRGRSPFRQSDSGGRYQEALTYLEAGKVAPADSGAVYHCECSRRTIAATQPMSPPGEEPRYQGTCRHRGLAPLAGRGIRTVLPVEPVSFDDLVHGPQVQTPALQCGDLLLKDSLGNWTYQFAVVVDDLAHGVDLVVRGDDLLPSTGRQILLGELLDREAPPAFVHHPLIMGDTGAKLSKRDAATSLASLRAAGKTPAEVLGAAAHATGLVSEWRPLRVAELAGLFADPWR